MIPIKSPAGKGNYILRGIMTPDGAKNIANMRVLGPGGVDSTPVNEGDAVDSLTVTIEPSSVVGSVARAGTSRAFTSPATASSNGIAPLTYNWLQISGSAEWTIGRGAEATTGFRVDVSEGSSETAEFTCEVTDAVGATGSATVLATAYNYGAGRGF